jgi:subtilisin family serine protease
LSNSKKVLFTGIVYKEEYAMNLNKKIERIADESTSDQVSVIVQMKPEKNDLNQYLEATSDAIAKRSSIVSARALLPPRKELLKMNTKGVITPASRRRLQQLPSSSTAMLLASLVFDAVVNNEELISSGLNALQPLLQSNFVKTIVAEHNRQRTRKPTNESEPVHFWSSSSAVLDLTKDELKKLPTEVPRIADIYPNRTVKMPPVSKAEDLPRVVTDNKSNTWGLAKIGALSAWGVFGAKGKDVLVAVLDTGIDPDHPDLKGKIAGFAEFDRSGAEVPGSNENIRDAGEHGTHCAGIIAGGNASGRWIGVAPEAKILAGMVLTSDAEGEPIYGTDAQILGGIEWAIKSGAHVISMSLGGLRMTADVLDVYTRAVINANRKGIPVVVSVGNEGSQTSCSPGNDYFAFSVGATDVSDRAAGFSGGRTQIIENSRYISPQYLPMIFSKPDVSCPGVSIYSSVPNKTKETNNSWAALSGTSMAAPHVSGAMALLLSDPTTIAADLEGIQRVNFLQALLTSTVEELGESGQNHRFGYGRIDILRAFGYASELGYLK